MKVFNRAMLRVPQFPFDAKLEEVWKELLESIAYASPEFYRLVCGLEFKDLESQPEKIRHTIFKYFNRARFRCTPLGTFSSFGIVDLDAARPTGVAIGELRSFHRFADWKWIRELEYEFADVVERDFCLFANSSYYLMGESIKYVHLMLIQTAC